MYNILKPQEIRHGNLVDYLGMVHKVIVLPGDADNPTQNGFGIAPAWSAEVDRFLPLDCIDPLIITEDRLKRLCYQKQLVSVPTQVTKTGQLVDKWPHHIFNNSLFQFLKDFTTQYERIYFIHRLQNLIYVIKGWELTAHKMY
jgi:hypothetical protein